MTVFVLILIGWWFVRNYMLYDGDLLGRNASAICAQKYASPGLKPSDKQTPMSEGLTLFEMLSRPYGSVTISWVELVSRSFVGRFGSLDIAMPAWIENNYMDFIKFGVLLVLIHPVRTFALKNKDGFRKDGIFNWCMLIAMIIPNLLNAWYSYSSDYQPQGRYSLPMLVALTYFMVVGYGNLFDELVRSVKVRKNVYRVLCFLVIGLSVYVYLTVFWPAYMTVPFGIGAFLTGAA